MWVSLCLLKLPHLQAINDSDASWLRRTWTNVSLLSHSCKDQEEQGQREVQGALQQVPVHPGHHRQGEGGEAEAVPASRWVVAIFKVLFRVSDPELRKAAGALGGNTSSLPPTLTAVRWRWALALRLQFVASALWVVGWRLIFDLILLLDLEQPQLLLLCPVRLGRVCLFLAVCRCRCCGYLLLWFITL